MKDPNAPPQEQQQQELDELKNEGLDATKTQQSLEAPEESGVDAKHEDPGQEKVQTQEASTSSVGARMATLEMYGDDNRMRSNEQPFQASRQNYREEDEEKSVTTASRTNESCLEEGHTRVPLLSEGMQKDIAMPKDTPDAIDARKGDDAQDVDAAASHLASEREGRALAASNVQTKVAALYGSDDDDDDQIYNIDYASPLKNPHDDQENNQSHANKSPCLVPSNDPNDPMQVDLAKSGATMSTLESSLRGVTSPTGGKHLPDTGPAEPSPATNVEVGVVAHVKSGEELRIHEDMPSNVAVPVASLERFEDEIWDYDGQPKVNPDHHDSQDANRHVVAGVGQQVPNDDDVPWLPWAGNNHLHHASVGQAARGGRYKRAAIVGTFLVLVVAAVAGVILTRGEQDSPMSINMDDPKASSTPPPREVPTFTLAPSPAPTSIAEALMTLIMDASPDNGQALNDTSSPQRRAFEWLQGNTNLADYSDEQKLQRYALGTLYLSTNGESWDTNDGWLTDDDECTWFSDVPVNEEECANGALVNLYLGDNNLQGTIPPEVSMLSNSLKVLFLHYNKFNGTIPTEMGLMTHLNELDLEDSMLTGTIPTEIGSMTNLIELYLNDNSLIGTIPSEMGLSTNLHKLFLFDNSLSGTIPTEIDLLTNLDRLWLFDNDFTGNFTCQDYVTFCYVSCDSSSSDCRVVGDS